MKKQLPIGLLFFLAILSLLVGCSLGGGSNLDRQLRAIIAERGLTGDPSVGRDLPGIEEPLPQLGMKLNIRLRVSRNRRRVDHL